jgi:hypothetical protein
MKVMNVNLCVKRFLIASLLVGCSTVGTTAAAFVGGHKLRDLMNEGKDKSIAFFSNFRTSKSTTKDVEKERPMPLYHGLPESSPFAVNGEKQVNCLKDPDDPICATLREGTDRKSVVTQRKVLESSGTALGVTEGKDGDVNGADGYTTRSCSCVRWTVFG